MTPCSSAFALLVVCFCSGNLSALLLTVVLGVPVPWVVLPVAGLNAIGLGIIWWNGHLVNKKLKQRAAYEAYCREFGITQPAGEK